MHCYYTHIHTLIISLCIIYSWHCAYHSFESFCSTTLSFSSTATSECELFITSTQFLNHSWQQREERNDWSRTAQEWPGEMQKGHAVWYAVWYRCLCAACLCAAWCVWCYLILWTGASISPQPCCRMAKGWRRQHRELLTATVAGQD